MTDIKLHVDFTDIQRGVDAHREVMELMARELRNGQTDFAARAAELFDEIADRHNVSRGLFNSIKDILSVPPTT